MSNKLIISLNGTSAIEYDRSVRLPGHQRQYLDKMDADMDPGIELGGEFIAEPDQMQRAQFVAMYMVQALIDEQDAMIAASCAYLANRLPDLKQVRAEEKNDLIEFDLVFNEEQKNQVVVNFNPEIN